MTHDRDQLWAYLATLGALVITFCAALWAASTGKLSSMEALGVGTVTGGLIGALKAPAQRQVTIDNKTSDPVPTDPQS